MDRTSAFFGSTEKERSTLADGNGVKDATCGIIICLVFSSTESHSLLGSDILEYFHLRQLALEQLRVEDYVTMSSPFDVIAIITPKPGKADRVCLEISTNTIVPNKQLMFSRSKSF